MKIKVGKNFVASFSYKEDKEAILTELAVIAAREGKHKSEIIINLIEEYVKAHGAGNPSFKLDNWQEDPEFQAIPTILADKEKWKTYLRNNCSKEDLTKIAISATYILKETTFCKTGKYRQEIARL